MNSIILECNETADAEYIIEALEQWKADGTLTGYVGYHVNYNKERDPDPEAIVWD